MKNLESILNKLSIAFWKFYKIALNKIVHQDLY